MSSMRSAKNDENESGVYIEFLAIDLTEQQEFNENNNTRIIKIRKLKDSISTSNLLYNDK
jgi:hypothetical protein